MLTEIWKDIPGYEGIYQVNNMGEVKSLSRVIPKWDGVRTTKEKVHKQFISSGYCRIILSNNSKDTHFLVHRLVALVFITNPENKRFIDHINGNRLDNRVENLRWCTRLENQNNPIAIEKMRKSGISRGISVEMRKKAIEKTRKPVAQINIDTGDVINSYKSAKEAYRKTAICNASISQVCSGYRKSAGGYNWKFI